MGDEQEEDEPEGDDDFGTGPEGAAEGTEGGTRAYGARG